MSQGQGGRRPRRAGSAALAVLGAVAILAPIVVTFDGPARTTTRDAVQTSPRTRAGDNRAAGLVPDFPSELGPGTHRLTTTIDGVARSWTVVVPAGRVPGVPAPLLVLLHGVGGQGTAMRWLGFEPLAAARGVMIAYPDGAGGGWNDGRPGAEPLDPLVEPFEEIAFLRAMVGETARFAGADRERVAVVGFSNGAMMANRAACEFGPGLRVVVMVDGSAGSGFEETCRPAGVPSVMVVAATGDQVVPYDGGEVARWRGRPRGHVASVGSVVDFWRRRGACEPLEPAQSVSVEPPVVALEADDCLRDVSILHYRVTSSAHEWHRGAGFDTTAAVWRFVTRALRMPA